jgi:hypothetical protein
VHRKAGQEDVEHELRLVAHERQRQRLAQRRFDLAVADRRFHPIFSALPVRHREVRERRGAVTGHPVGVRASTAGAGVAVARQQQQQRRATTTSAMVQYMYHVYFHCRLKGKEERRMCVMVDQAWPAMRSGGAKAGAKPGLSQLLHALRLCSGAPRPASGLADLKQLLICCAMPGALAHS